jgi:hypothetical protein
MGKVYHNFSLNVQGRIMATPIPQAIDKATSDRISFVAYIVPAFAEAYKMNVQDAFKYLKKYGGWDFLHEHWWVLHVDNDIWAVHDIYTICHQNGGER